MPLEPVAQALSDNIAKGNYKKALTFCDKKLVLEPQNQAAARSKSLCYIQLGQDQEALDFIQTLSPEMQAASQTERAYCLYKLRKHDELLKLIKDTEKPSTALLHLQGQTLYRMGEYQAAKDVFNSIRKEKDTPEILVNIAAAASLGKISDDEIRKLQSANKDSSELAFNFACSLIDNNQLAAAEQQLLLSEKICREILPDQEYTEKEIEDEVAGARAQLAYIYQMTGREEEAAVIYEEVLKNKPSDASVMAVASNNVATLSKDHKLFNVEKNLFHALSAMENHKLVPDQEQVVHFNRAVVYLKMGKVQKCREVIKELEAAFPKSPLLALIYAALLFKEEKLDEAQKELQKNAKGGDLSSKLALAQLLLKEGKSDQCLASLADLGEDSHRLGVVATRMKILHQLERPADATKVMQAAIDFWTSKKDQAMLIKMLLAAGDFDFSQGSYKSASEHYKQLVALDKANSQFYVPKLVIALSHVDPAAAASYAENLPEVPAGAEEIDIEKLENVSLYRANKDSSPEEAEGDGTQLEKKKKKKNKKKKRLPKNYNPNVAPDPERWLPQTQRSTYKKKKKKMRGGHQGSDSGVEAPVKAQPTGKATAVPPSSGKGKKGKKGGRR